jgi:glycosyltransferase involved in cell wall biosynthesis
MLQPSASVVIPAHNEEAVIGRLLEATAAAAEPGELLVVVACNGCTDATAAIARGFDGVEVIEVETASKTEALNAGDAAARDVFPRLYLDADIHLDIGAVRAVVAALDVDEPRAAAPRLHTIVTDRPAVVRGFYHVFTRLPWSTDNLVGSGFYGVSRAGRARFGPFPHLTNDDLLVRELFASHERVSVREHQFAIETPRTVGALVRAKARVARGVTEYQQIDDDAKHARGESTRKPRGGSLPFLRLAAHPRHWAPLAAYAYVRCAARLRRRLDGARSGAAPWGQDRTTRATQS